MMLPLFWLYIWRKAARVGLVRGTVDVPAGIEAVLEQRFAAMGLPAVGVWAQVPHYAAPYAGGAIALIRRVETADGEVLFSAAPKGDRAVSEATAKLFAENEYQQYLLLHGIGTTRDDFAALRPALEAGTVLARFGPVRWLRPASAWYDDEMLSTINNLKR